MAQTRYSDLRDTFHVSRFTNNGLLRPADFFSILLACRLTDLLDRQPDDKTAACRDVPFDPHPPA